MELEPKPAPLSPDAGPLELPPGSRSHGHGGASCDPRSVLTTWLAITGLELTEKQRTEFLCRSATAVLAAQPLDALQKAGERLWLRRKRLDLLEWVLEADWPGLPDVVIHAADLVATSPEVGLALHELVAAAVARLPAKRGRYILEERLGLDGRGTVRTLKELGEELDVSRERVRQLQEQALRTLGTPRDSLVPRADDYCRQVLSRLLDEIDADHQDQRVELLLDATELAFPQVPPSLAVSALVWLAGRGKKASQAAGAAIPGIIKARQREKKRASQEHALLQRTDERVQAVLDQVEWPNHRAKAEGLEGFVPLRTSKEGRWFSEKLAREVSYDSRLELSIMQLLDRCSQVTEYCEQPLAIDYELDGKIYPYHPDLLLLTGEGDLVLVEIKPLADMGLTINRAKWAAARQECANRGWGFLATDGYRSFATVAGHQVPDEIRARFRERLRQGPMYWPDIRLLQGEHEPRYLIVHALAIQEGWDLRQRPFRLRLRLRRSAV
ncbi:TnsA endonuclease N-terminal domain-containing protein [Actinomadura sp. NPDC048394]|uniref:TnsA endonuclease N-terminal domain-containing protein n=1 Tax=Actinomadura sp. NPDC048394 TaxID=3158223 RepID=UPI00340D39E2